MPLTVIKTVIQLPDGVDMLEDDDITRVRVLPVHVEDNVNRAGLLKLETSGCPHLS